MINMVKNAFLSCAMFLITASIHAAELNWDVNTWPAPIGGVPTLSQTYVIGGGNVTVTISGDTGALTTTATGTAASPQTNSRNTGGIDPAENSLLLRMDFPEGTPAVDEQEVTVTYTFSHPGGVNIPQFDVFDVDSSGSNQFTDIAIATGTLAAGGAINPTNILSGTANSDDGVNTATGTGGSGGTSSAGNVSFVFGQSGVNSFTFTYRNDAPNTAGSHLQAASIHDISFFIAPTVDKIFNPNVITSGGVSTVTITLGNNEVTNATLSADLVDTLPVGMTIASPANIGGSCPGTTNATVGGNTITYTSGSVIPPGTCTITVDITSATPGTFANTIDIGELQTNFGLNTFAASDDLTVNVPIAPTVSKTFSPDTISINSTSTLTIVLGNSNTFAATLSTALVDILPTAGNGDVVIASTPNIGGTCNSADVTAVAGATSVTYANNANIPVGGCSITVDVTSPTAGTYTNTIATGALQTNLGNNANSASDNLTVNVGSGSVSCPSGSTLTNQTGNADVATQTGGTQNPEESEGVLESIIPPTTANNTNSARLRSGDTLTLDLTDTVPLNGVIVISIARDNNGGNVRIEDSTDNGVSDPYSDGTITFNSGPNDTLQRINYIVSSANGARFLRLTRLSGRVWVDGASYSQICVSSPTSDLSITKDDSSLTYTPGGTGTYTIIVTNNGPDDVSGATITDNLPDGVTMTSAWTCIPSSVNSSCNTVPSTTDPISIDVDITDGDTITINVPVQYSSSMGDY